MIKKMEADYSSWLPEPLLDDILLAAGIKECYLRPLSVLSKQLQYATDRLKHTLHITTRNNHFLPRLLKRFPHIKHINLPFFSDPQRFFSELSRFGIRLESLDMSLNSSFPISRLTELPPASLTSLKSLKLSYVEDQDDADADLGILADLLPGLEELELPWGYQVTDNGVEMLASKLSNLRRISFGGSHLITDYSIYSLGIKGKKLEEIALSGCSSISAIGIYRLELVHNLKSVALQGMCKIGTVDPFRCAFGLSMLELSFMEVPDDLLKNIATARMPLKRFSLSECTSFTHDGILTLLGACHSTLEYFAIEHSTSIIVKPTVLSAFLWNVTVLKLNYCCILSPSQLLALIHNCRKLNTLELKGAHLCVDQVHPALRYNTKSQIRSLNLSFSETLTDECLQQLAPACPQLAELFVTDCKAISHRGVNQILRTCSSLRLLRMNGCEGVSRLSFNIGSAKLEVLEAWRSGLDGESLVLIASKCPELMCLDLSNCCNVTALGVRQVVINCKHLWKLEITFKDYAGSGLEYWIRSHKPWLVNSLM